MRQGVVLETSQPQAIAVYSCYYNSCVRISHSKVKHKSFFLRRINSPVT